MNTTASVPHAVRFDIFISHASEDKDDFVRPLAAALTALGLRIWYDEWTLTIGDSLRQKIDEGLAASDYGVVILSRTFFGKKWTQAELDGLFAREMGGRKVILPVWHNITPEEVRASSPLLAGKLGAPTDEGVEAVARKLFAAVRPHSTLPKPTVQASHAAPVGAPIHSGNSFAVSLGKRHKHLRENILGINPRRMADFYGFEKVGQLEACERGDDEFPTAAIKGLSEFFFVDRLYLEGESQEVFDSFDVTSSADDCEKYIGEGFRPHLLCLNEDREKLWCWLVFHKKQDGFDRVFAADSHGYFASVGGGKSNVMHLIEAAHRHGLGIYEIYILTVNRKVWEELEKSVFYRKNLRGGGVGGADDVCRDRFLVWWNEFEAKNL